MQRSTYNQQLDGIPALAKNISLKRTIPSSVILANKAQPTTSFDPMPAYGDFPYWNRNAGPLWPKFSEDAGPRMNRWGARTQVESSIAVPVEAKVSEKPNRKLFVITQGEYLHEPSSNEALPNATNPGHLWTRRGIRKGPSHMRSRSSSTNSSLHGYKRSANSGYFWAGRGSGKGPSSVDSRSSSMNSSLHGYEGFDPEEQNPTFLDERSERSSAEFQDTSRRLPLPPKFSHKAKAHIFKTRCDICGIGFVGRRRRDWQ